MSIEKKFDYIVVGAGTSGCILANRLSQNKSHRVLLIEAGEKPKSFWIDMPAGVSRLIFPGTYNWGYNTAPEANLHGRSIYAPRGKGLGGSSLINGMAYFRGQPQDYDAWQVNGCEGWGWENIKKLYDKLQTIQDDGAGLQVTPPSYVHPSSHAFVDSAKSLGIPYNSDFNASTTDGAGLIHFSIKNAERHSSYKAFIEPIQNARKNLTVITKAQAQRILITDGKAYGLTVIHNGAQVTFECSQEIIVCAGAFASPQLLLQSGIGDAGHLQSQNIPVVANLPGVGQNLQDHMYIHHTYASDSKSSLNRDFRGINAILHGINYVFNKSGPLTSGASQACAFVRSSESIERPDLQICYRPVSWVFDQHGTMEIGKTPEVTVSVCNLRPTSRGRVVLSNGKNKNNIEIQANYLDTDNDKDVAIKAVKKVREIFKAHPLSERVKQEITPGSSVTSDVQILDYIKSSAQSMHHWVGTCKMGNDDLSVVDHHLKVRGIQGLRVADASIMPTIVSANTNAASYVIGEKAAEIILANA